MQANPFVKQQCTLAVDIDHYIMIWKGGKNQFLNYLEPVHNMCIIGCYSQFRILTECAVAFRKKNFKKKRWEKIGKPLLLSYNYFFQPPRKSRILPIPERIVSRIYPRQEQHGLFKINSIGSKRRYSQYRMGLFSTSFVLNSALRIQRKIRSLHTISLTKVWISETPRENGEYHCHIFESSKVV